MVCLVYTMLIITSVIFLLVIGLTLSHYVIFQRYLNFLHSSVPVLFAWSTQNLDTFFVALAFSGFSFSIVVFSFFVYILRSSNWCLGYNLLPFYVLLLKILFSSCIHFPFNSLEDHIKFYLLCFTHFFFLYLTCLSVACNFCNFYELLIKCREILMCTNSLPGTQKVALIGLIGLRSWNWKIGLLLTYLKKVCLVIVLSSYLPCRIKNIQILFKVFLTLQWSCLKMF